MKKIKSFIVNSFPRSSNSNNYNSSDIYADSGFYENNKITPDVIDSLLSQRDNLRKILRSEDAIEAARLGMEILKDYINTV